MCDGFLADIKIVVHNRAGALMALLCWSPMELTELEVAAQLDQHGVMGTPKFRGMY